MYISIGNSVVFLFPSVSSRQTFAEANLHEACKRSLLSFVVIVVVAAARLCWIPNCVQMRVKEADAAGFCCFFFQFFFSSRHIFSYQFVFHTQKRIHRHQITHQPNIFLYVIYIFEALYIEKATNACEQYIKKPKTKKKKWSVVYTYCVPTRHPITFKAFMIG